jgi:hypothetical protein
MIPPGRSRLRRVRRAGLLAAGLLAVVVLAGCGTISNSPPVPTAAPFPTIAGRLSLHGIQVTGIVSGDAGCPDANLAKTAIGFDAAGLDQATPVRLHVYIFKDRATYERLRATIDQCAASFVTDPATFESVETSPYVVAGQGPWGSAFKDNIRVALVEAAGTGD